MAELKYGNIISQMTLEEKASLMSGKNFWETQDIKKYGIPSIFLADGPHGIRKQIASADHLGLNESTKATCFPTASALASSWNIELANKVGVALGKEARHQDVNVLLGPGMNTKRNVLCGRNFEYFSEDPYLAGKIAANMVTGIQESGVSACIKHFACNSQEYRRMNSDSVVDERALRELYLTNFEIAIKEGKPNCIMSSYNLVNGEYANENTYLSNVLRNEWGFDGVMVSDWGGSNDRVKGLLAGNQLEMPGNDGDTIKDIINAVKEGTIEESVLDDAVDKLLDLVFKTQKEEGKDYSINLEEHNALAIEAEEESIVLLENTGILPLKKKAKVCVIGKFAEETRYQGAGSSKVNSYKVDKLLDILPNYDLNFVGYEEGFDFKGKPDKKKVEKAVELAKTSDIIILMIGLDDLSEAEGIDRETMNIPQNQLELIDALTALRKKIVACLCSGSAVEIPFNYAVNALVHYHLGGQGVMTALMNVLTGKVNPSGKLSESYPIKYNDSPTFKYFHKKPNTAEYKESIYVGYRYYDKNGLEVKYPFGYGKSYTTFKYSNLVVNEKGATFKVTNTGEVDGKEVCQMYVSFPETQFFRAENELKGFSKIFLKAGETKTVHIPFNEYTFRFYNVVSKEWEIEGGNYFISVGGSSRELFLNKKYAVKGTLTKNPYDRRKIHTYLSGMVNDVKNDNFEVILGRKRPSGSVHFINKKKNRIEVDQYTTIEYLRYARGWSGRFFNRMIRFAIWFMKKIGKRETANTLIMGVYNQPLRGLSRFSNGKVHWTQLQGLIIMFNGKFFKGLKVFFGEGKKIKKERKALKALEKEQANKSVEEVAPKAEETIVEQEVEQVVEEVTATEIVDTAESTSEENKEA